MVSSEEIKVKTENMNLSSENKECLNKSITRTSLYEKSMNIEIKCYFFKITESINR